MDLAPDSDGLSLRATSPGLNSGSALGQRFAGSINSVVRPSVSGWDMGAYERVPVAYLPIAVASPPVR